MVDSDEKGSGDGGRGDGSDVGNGDEAMVNRWRRRANGDGCDRNVGDGDGASVAMGAAEMDATEMEAAAVLEALECWMRWRGGGDGGERWKRSRWSRWRWI